MKKLFTLVFLASVYFPQAQIATLFSEDFESGIQPFTVTTAGGATGSLVKNGSDLFQTGRALQIDKPAAQNDSVFIDLLTLHNDSITQYSGVELHFEALSSLYIQTDAILQYSTDNKATWTTISSSNYLGNGSLTSGNINFNGLFHSSWQPSINSTNLDSTQWKHEVFDIHSLAGSQPGFLHLRLVVAETLLSSALSRNPTMLLLDNFQVVGSNICSPVLPRIKPGTPNQNFCDGFEVKNLQYVSLTPTLSFQFDFSNQSNIDSTYLEKFVNGSSNRSIQLITLGNYIRLIPGASDTVIKYRIKTVNTCGGVQYYPSKGFRIYNAQPISPTCGNGTCKDGVNVLSSFPMNEGFEGPGWNGANSSAPVTNNSYRGGFADAWGQNWFVSPAANSSLILNSFCVSSWSSVGNPNFGPTTGAIAQPGSNYLHFRGDISTGSNTSRVISPCIDLRNDSNIVLTFDYQVVGDQFFDMLVGVRNISAGETSFSTLVDLNKSRQVSGADPFRKAFIPLNNYAGSIIQVRLQGRINPPSGSKSTFAAIDNFELRQTHPNEISLFQIKSNLMSCIDNQDTAYVDLFALDTTIAQIPISYSVNGSVLQSSVNIPANHSITDTITIALPVSQPLTRKNQLKVWHTLSGDPVNIDDTLSTSWELPPSISSFPYHQDFENLLVPNELPFWTAKVLGNLSNSAELQVFEGIYPSDTTGPRRGVGMGSKYFSLAALSTDSSKYASGYTATIESACMDVSALASPVFSFDYYLLNNAGAQIKVEYTRNGVDYFLLQNLSSNNSSGNKRQENWDKAVIPLTNLNSAFKLRITLESTGSFVGPFDLGTAIDNIELYDRGSAQTDYSLLNIIDRYKGAGNNDLLALIHIRSTVSIATSNLSLKLLFEPICGGATDSVTLSLPLSTQTNQTREVIFTGFQNFNLAPGEYNYKAILSSNIDNRAINDSTEGYMNVYSPQTVPYFNDFDNCFDGANNSLGTYGTWKRRTQKSTLGSSPYSGLYSLNLDSLPENVVSPSESILLPVLNGFDTIASPRISFYHRYSLTALNNARLEMNMGNGWVRIDSTMGINPINWPGGSFEGFQSNYQISSIEIPQLSYYTGIVRFRFVVNQVSNTTHWTIDDLKVDVPIQHNIAPIKLHTTNAITETRAIDMELTVQNIGAVAIDSFNTDFYINGQYWFGVNNILSNTLFRGANKKIRIKTFVPLSLSGNTFEIMTVTRLPNGRIDGVAADDTVINNTSSLINDTNALPFCLDFENFEKPVTSNSQNFGERKQNFWITGTPQKSNISGAANASNAIYTSANNTYDAFEDAAFYPPAFAINDSDCYEFSFNHHFDTEQNYDGGLVEYSLDSGKTWLVMGSFDEDDSLWYNTPFVIALENVNPGFSGKSNGYIKAKQELTFNATGLLYTRFRFKSDFNNVVGNGWSIDDICMEVIPGCQNVGQDESLLNKPKVAIFPNPTNGIVSVKGSSNSEFKAAQLIDVSGKLLWKQDHFEERAAFQINLTEFAIGTYYLKILHSDNSISYTKILKN